MKWRGSYTVEAAVIIPVLIWTMAAAMCTGIDLLHEAVSYTHLRAHET